MTLATVLAFLAFTGLLGPRAEALAGFIGLFTAFAATPVLAFLTGGRYYLARQPDPAHSVSRRQTCCVCEYTFDQPDMASCPAYDGPDLFAMLHAGRALRRSLQAFATAGEQMNELLGEAKGGETAVISRRWALNYATVFLSLTALVGCIVSLRECAGAGDAPRGSWR